MNIFITGAESTGKSTLTRMLAEYFSVPFVEEYARAYVSGLKRDYNFDDLEVIAEKQIEEISGYQSEELVFFDTGLIITYIWYQEKYGFVPDWLIEAMPVYGKGKYLLCNPDISWVNDPVRENPHRRDELNRIYEAKIKELGFDIEIVEGEGEKRFQRALKIVEKWQGKA